MTRMPAFLSSTTAPPFLRLLLACILVLCAASVLHPYATAQNKGTPGKFDFYLLDMPWGPEFCAIKDVSHDCKPQRGFVLHGLWPQFNNGTWPVFCSEERGPADLRRDLDVTPDLQLLQHEWDKHGTCSAAGPKRFFALERQARHSVAIPSELQHIEADAWFTPEWILQSFAFANPSFPRGSFALSCNGDKLTAIEACFSRSLQPIPCQGIHSCKAQVLHLQRFPEQR